MTNARRSTVVNALAGSERVAKCNQKRRMMGCQQITVWLDKDAVGALRALKERYDPLSATKIVGHLIKMAAKAAP